jgi:hypothetical protein
MNFLPNKLSFEQGLARVQEAFTKSGVKPPRGIFTSRDSAALATKDLLLTSNVPGGFKKWQLPFHLDGASQMFISIGSPDAEVPLHSHEEGDGVRFIMSGSILYGEQELTAGDWMYIPKGEKYKFKVGPVGVMQCYCYRCCCA